MSSRRFPRLVVTLTSSITDTSGLLPVDGLDYSSICDDDLVPGTSASNLLKEAVTDLIREALAVARTALDFDDDIRSGPFLAVLPRFNEDDYTLILVWRGSGSACYIATTNDAARLEQPDSEYAGYDAVGRITYFEGERPVRGA